jgi:prophage antirepressor-like protein
MEQERIKKVIWNGNEFITFQVEVNGELEWVFFAEQVHKALDYDKAAYETNGKPSHLKRDLETNCDNDEFLLMKANDLSFAKSGESDNLITRQGSYVITEQGIYGLILGSNKTEAKEFKKFVKLTLKQLREKSGLEAFEVWRMMDKQIQKNCHSFIAEHGILGDKADCIVMNKNVNEITSKMYSINPPIKKPDMEKYYPEMMLDRQKIQNDYCILFGYTGSHKQSKEMITGKIVNN